MSNKQRSPLQVSDKFLVKLKDLQKKVRMATGSEKSLRSLTEDIVNTPAFEELERNLGKGDIRLNLNVRFDKRII